MQSYSRWLVKKKRTDRGPVKYDGAEWSERWLHHAEVLLTANLVGYLEDGTFCRVTAM